MILFSAIVFVILLIYLALGDVKLNESLSRWLDARARLKSTILSQSSVRWQLCPDTTLLLNMSFKNYDVLACDEVEQSFTTVNFMDLTWTDAGIAWDPADFDDLQSLTLSYDDLWHPRISVTNAADQEFAIIKPLNDHIQVSYTGEVRLKSTLFLKTTCSMDLTWYPFDQQDCHIVFLPFNDDCHYEISSKILENLPNPFELSGEWDVKWQNISPFTYRNVSSKELTAVRVSLVLVRGSLFYVITFIAPLILTSLMTSFVFIIPPDSGEKVSFLVSIFVSNAVFLNFIAGTLPRAMTIESIPRLTLLLIGVMVHSFLALLATLFVMQKYKSEHKAGNELSTTAKTKKQHSSGSDYSTHDKENNKSVNDAANYGKEVMASKNFSQINTTRRVCKLSSRLWDFIFFVLFNIASVSFCYMLVAIPSQVEPSWSGVM